MSTSSKRTYKKTTVKIFWNRILASFKESDRLKQWKLYQLLWFHIISSYTVQCTACTIHFFCRIFIAFFSISSECSSISDLLRTNEWIDSIESITRLIQWICLMRYILSSLTIFSFTNNTVAIHAKQCCLTINLSADRKKI